MNHTEILPEPLHSWTQRHFGLSLAVLSNDPIPVVEIEPEAAIGPFVAFHRSGRGALAARPEWTGEFSSMIGRLPMEMIFSPFGCAELSRVTLPHGYGVWGPIWYLFGDDSTVVPREDKRPRRFTPDELREVDYNLFWHCSREAVTGFVMAMVGPFNVPSVRTLRAVGLHYAFTTLEAMEGPFRIPPQPLGSPLPDAEVFDYYPRWAMNRKIKPRP